LKGRASAQWEMVEPPVSAADAVDMLLLGCSANDVTR
jgi:hypothetical protein